MELPISRQEFEKILEILKRANKELYSKLWCYKMNYLNKEKNGLS